MVYLQETTRILRQQIERVPSRDRDAPLTTRRVHGRVSWPIHRQLI